MLCLFCLVSENRIIENNEQNETIHKKALAGYGGRGIHHLCVVLRVEVKDGNEESSDGAHC